jgi:acetolactate synthase-1/2/3 large subunit
MKLSDYVFEVVAGLGVKHVFMLPGGGAMHLVDSLGRNAHLEAVCNLHEQACAIAAEAYGRTTNNLGVALVTSGPGGTNALTGLAGAWLASTPCLFISGQVKRRDMKSGLGLRQRGPQELCIVDIVSSVTKYAITVMDPNTIRFHLERAIHAATTGRKGPVWIDVPLDIQAVEIEPTLLQGFTPPKELGLEGNASRAAEVILEMLRQAERPVVLLGNGLHASELGPRLLTLLERLGAPVLTTWAATDLIPEAHPLCFGKPGLAARRGANFTLQNSDFLLSLGARLDFDVTGYNPEQFARGARKAVVDVDPAELAKPGVSIDLPLCMDAGELVDPLLAGIEGQPVLNLDDWLCHCREWKDQYPLILQEHREQKNGIHPFVFTELLCEALDPDDLVLPGSSGSAIDMFWMAFKAKPNQRAFSTGGLGAMGFGIPAAIGGCLARGRRKVVSIDGDGGFVMNIQELATVASMQLPIIFFVMNNQGYASIRVMQRNHFEGRLVGCDDKSGMTLPDFRKVAPAFGIPYLRLEDPAELKLGIHQALSHPGPLVCEVILDPEQGTTPKVSSIVRPDGSIASRPLEDLWPFLERDELRANLLIPPIED